MQFSCGFFRFFFRIRTHPIWLEKGHFVRQFIIFFLFIYDVNSMLTTNDLASKRCVISTIWIDLSKRPNYCFKWWSIVDYIKLELKRLWIQPICIVCLEISHQQWTIHMMYLYISRKSRQVSLWTASNKLWFVKERKKRIRWKTVSFWVVSNCNNSRKVNFFRC